MVFENHEYPQRVTLDADGFYRWKTEMDDSRKLEQFKNMVTICLIVSLVIYAVMALVSMNSTFFKDIMLSGLGLIAGMVGLPALLWWLLEIKLQGKTYQKFEMNGEYVKHVGVSGKDTHYADFKAIRKIQIKRRINMIWVRGLFGGVQVFVPPEDFRFVLEYIHEKANDKAQVEYL
ncbi:MAG: hypothetical protein IKH30_16440 [Clostridia bacterium]|nr:hypothetical protein [Clostridia bacterium]